MKNLITSLARLAETIRYGFCRLTERQFDAPWRSTRSHCG